MGSKESRYLRENGSNQGKYRGLARAIPATGIIIREAFDCEARRCEGLSRQAPHRGIAMVATAPPEGLLASETEPPWALAVSEAAWRPSP